MHRGMGDPPFRLQPGCRNWWRLPLICVPTPCLTPAHPLPQKRMRLAQLPPVLCLHLKRFKYIESMGRWVLGAVLHSLHRSCATCVSTSPPDCLTASLPPTRLKKLMHRVTFPWELKMINTTDDCPDAGALLGLQLPTLASMPRKHSTCTAQPSPARPRSRLSLSPCADSSYELFAVVVHMGAHPNHGECGLSDAVVPLEQHAIP